MKIAMVAPTYLPSRRANTIQVMKMAQAMAALGHTVHVAVPDDESRTPPTWEELACQYGLRQRFTVEWLPARRRLKRYDYGMASVGWARRLSANLLYTRLPQAAAVSSLLGMPTIFEMHDLPQGHLGPLALRLFLRGSGKRRLVAITRALAADLHEQLGAPEGPPFTVVAPDGVDLERYQDLPAPAEARRILGLPEQTFMAGYTGHLYPGRGVEMILDLAGRLPHITFLVAGGEAPDVARLQNEVQSRNLHNLILTGFINNSDLPRYQAACDALLMPYGARVAASSGGDISRYLSPMKLFEYLACGRPILSSQLPVLQEVLNPGNALLLPSGDVDAWSGWLERLRGDPALAGQLAAQARADAQKYTWEARARRILENLNYAAK